MFIEQLQSLLGEDLLLNQPMKNHTTFKIGGPADIMAVPAPEQLFDVLLLCKQHKIPFFIMGNGSNLLIGDKGIRGVVIKTAKCRNIDIQTTVDDYVYISCGAGVLMSAAAGFALRNSLGGFEFASGIPGTMGAAVAINAGAYGTEMKDVVTETYFINTDTMTRHHIDNSGHMFGYRQSVFCDSNKVITECVIKLSGTDKEEIVSRTNKLNARRKEKQPLEYPSAGSVFKRPEGFYAGKLIEDSGLKGFSIGGAMVSPQHCGFIINTGNAIAQDVLNLIIHIKNTVKDKFGVDLHTEIKMAGEF